MPHFRDFNADREERFLAYRLSKRKPEETKEVIDIDDVEEEAEEEEIDDSWLLDTDEEQAEIEEADTE